jgi:hypothetical protein
MRQKRGSQRSRAIWVIAAGGAGYLLGSWNASALHSPYPAASAIPAQAAQAPVRAVALRFQQDFNQPATQFPAGMEPTTPAVATAAMVLGSPHFALFQPEPMEPRPPEQQRTAEPTSSEIAELTPPATTPHAAPAAPIWHAPPRPTEAAKPYAELHRLGRRPRSMLDDAQIASIRRRLHLTAYQEQMWPPVAAALRNIGLEREREARLGARGAIDPDSAAVQDLKSAAIPLLMSFSDEQKDEVRNLARNMGLDQLASEF